jgi:hypothetical protein
MFHLSRRLFLTALAAGVGLQAGCNFGSLAFFLMPEQRLEAKLKHLASTDEKTKPKVLILAHAALDLDTDFLHAERELAENLTREIKALAAAFREKIELVPQRQVEEYKNMHPRWKSLELTEIGKKFNADYVIYLDIHSMSMKNPKNVNMLSGKTNITVTLCDVKNPEDSPSAMPFTFVYPTEERGGVPIDNDTHPTKFRQEFLARAARKLAFYFMKYPRSELTSME